MKTVNIKHENGMVTFRMRAGKDMVRSTMHLPTAKSIIAKAKTTEEINGELVVDDLYFFPIKPEKKREKDETTEVLNND
jgi:hypothetical protein